METRSSSISTCEPVAFGRRDWMKPVTLEASMASFRFISGQAYSSGWAGISRSRGGAEAWSRRRSAYGATVSRYTVVWR
jgi:hypothetical protein